jgi:hypothetical protein
VSPVAIDRPTPCLDQSGRTGAGDRGLWGLETWTELAFDSQARHDRGGAFFLDGVFLTTRNFAGRWAASLSLRPPPAFSLKGVAMETESPTKAHAGVGMPQQVYLHEFGSKLWDAFGQPSYLVGSVLTSKAWRDVDVRFLMDDEEYDRWFPGVKNVRDEHQCGKWLAWCLAFSALGEKMTGLPIDFQVQRRSEANELYDSPRCPRSCIGIIPLRLAKGK